MGNKWRALQRPDRACSGLGQIFPSHGIETSVVLTVYSIQFVWRIAANREVARCSVYCIQKGIFGAISEYSEQPTAAGG